ncbi:MAG TPA: glycosyltransferase family 92 protein [Rhabdochlamydiaceae bacterium]|nr:glycosyltransferase family 92 protein [Rhabdochlamydiaceae bacterium]
MSNVFILLLLQTSMHSQEWKVLLESPKKYNVSICAIFKNEAKYLKEWIEYHRLIGVDHFYLYNLSSTDQFMEVLSPYIKNHILTLVHWPDFIGCQDEEYAFKWALGTQIPAYEHAAHFLAVKETTWLVFLNVDEFLVCPQTKNLKETLEKYDTHPGITLSCDFFDASTDTFPKRQLLIETLELTKPPKQSVHKKIAKTIFKPDLCKGFIWPPYECLFKSNETAVSVKKWELRINHYTNRNEGFFFAKAKEKLPIDNRMLDEELISELLALDYAIEDQDRVIYQFIPEMLKKMGYDPRWVWE